MKKLLDRLWQLFRRGSPHIQTIRSFPEQETFITIIGSEPLYPEPEYGDAELFSQTHDYLFRISGEGPEIAIVPHALFSAMSHAHTNKEYEVGGICIGQVFQNKQDRRLLIHIKEVIPAETIMTNSQIQGKSFFTFTAEIWKGMINIYLRDFPGMRVLGWYHSHPGFGIFLSGMDLFIHNNFFNAPWHVAMVIDAIQHQVGFFTRHAEKLLPPAILSWDKELHSIH